MLLTTLIGIKVIQGATAISQHFIFVLTVHVLVTSSLSNYRLITIVLVTSSFKFSSSRTMHYMHYFAFGQ